MVELILSYILKFAVLGFAYYLVHSVFTKKIKDFHCSVDQNGMKIDGSFYKK